jgi:2-amino-4-hydroxy-6-hydroxymethyldihydropteridine diphosphokinase
VHHAAQRTQPERVYVALGSNLGDRAAYLAQARRGLAGLAHTRVLAASRIDETAPLGPPAQGPYLNQMIVLETTLAPPELLARLRSIEDAAGRVRVPHARWGPRTLDLDIVRFGERVTTDPVLTLPHPGLAAREFWQREMAEVDALAPPAPAP